MPVPTGEIGSGRGQRRGSQPASGSELRFDRQLRQLVWHFKACLSVLSPQARQTLILRAGLIGPSWSMAAVAGMLHLTPGREAQVETKAVAILLAAAASGGCQAGSSLVFGSSPRDLLASFSPFTGGGETFREQPFLASPAAGQVGMTAASAAKRAGPRPVEPPKAVLKSTLGRFPTHSRVVNDLLALGLVALLGALSVFAAERRRAAHRRQMRIRLAAHLESQRAAIEDDLAEAAALLERSAHRGRSRH